MGQNMALIVESDDWKETNPNLLKMLPRIKAAFEISVIAVEHWFYRGGRSPDHKFFEEFVDFEEYLSNEVKPGDRLLVWEFSKVCTKENAIAVGKIPDSLGRTPTRGAY